MLYNDACPIRYQHLVLNRVLVLTLINTKRNKLKIRKYIIHNNRDLNPRYDINLNKKKNDTLPKIGDTLISPVKINIPSSILNL